MNNQSDKVIDKDRFNLDDKATKRLSYEMVFLPEKKSENIDLLQALERSNREWNSRLSDEKQKAVKQGYEAGFADGEAKNRALVKEQIQPAIQALDEIQSFLGQFVESIKPDLTELVFMLAAKVVGVPVDSPELKAQISGEIAGYMAELADRSSIQIRVSEPDYDTIQHLVAETPVKNPVEIIRDKTLKPGEYRIDTNFEQISRSLEQRLDDFRKQAGIRFADD